MILSKGPRALYWGRAAFNIPFQYFCHSKGSWGTCSRGSLQKGTVKCESSYLDIMAKVNSALFLVSWVTEEEERVIGPTNFTNVNQEWRTWWWPMILINQERSGIFWTSASYNFTFTNSLAHADSDWGILVSEILNSRLVHWATDLWTTLKNITMWGPER